MLRSLRLLKLLRITRAMRIFERYQVGRPYQTHVESAWN